MVRKLCDRWFFRGSFAPGTSAGATPWLIKDTSAAGAPTYAGHADGLKLTLASTNESEVVTLYFGDILNYTLANILRAEFLIKMNAALGTNEECAIGLASAQNDTLDSVSYQSWFKIIGASTPTVVAESDDNVTNTDDVATGIALGTSTHKRLIIDFTEGVKTVGAPGVSKGQCPQFYMIDSQGVLQRVAVGTLFDMSGAAGTQGLQPFIQLQKASGTGVPSISVREVKIEYKEAA